MSERCVIGVTAGDPAGVGPEILLRSFGRLSGRAVPLVIGDRAVLLRAAALTGSSIRLHAATGRSSCREGVLNYHSLQVLTRRDYPMGTVDRRCGHASFVYVREAVRLWREGELDGLVTMPISKKAWHLAGHRYAGHTEYLSHSCGARETAMVMVSGRLRVVLVTTHIPLCRVPGELTVRRIVDKAALAAALVRRLGTAGPRILVAALNPHGGEAGILGSEEKKFLEPAVRALSARGFRCAGPVPADAVFRLAAAGAADLVVAMYHDQGMIALKSRSLDRLVNVTAGLPLVRTSPGHGTAFDIAGSGTARPGSFLEAYRLAVRLASARAVP